MTDYDSPWKNVLERFFPDFLAFYFPEAHAGIDWTQGYTMLDKELQKVVRDAALGRRWADSLVRVTGCDGREDWVLVHMEVQGEPDLDFPNRMFVYNYRIFDRYGRPVVSLAVLGPSVKEPFGHFGYQRWGCEFDEEKHMRYVSSFERIFSRRGMEKGIEQGIEQGMAIGIGKGQADLLRLLIQQRFGALPEDLDARLEGAGPEQLQAWGLRVLDAPSVEEVFRPRTGH